MKKEIKNILESVIKSYFTLGKPDKLKTEGFKEIKKLIKRYDVPFYKIKSELNPLIKQIEIELQTKFFSEHLKPFETEARQELNSIIKRNNFAVTTRQKKIEKIVTKVLSSDEKNIQESLQRYLGKIKIEQRHIDTEIFTTKLALNNLQRASSFKSGETEFLRYSGPSGTIRPFCEAHINRVYKLDEVEKMRNNFGQPALIYVGGYRCRHRWTPTFGEMETITNKEGNPSKLFVEDGFRETEGKELTIAKFRAKLGNDVTLIVRSEGSKAKIYDAEENGIKTEYKRIDEKSTNIRTSVQRNIRRGKEQAGNIVVYIDRDNYQMQSIERGIEYALDRDVKKKIRSINILNREGKIIYERNI